MDHYNAIEKIVYVKGKVCKKTNGFIPVIYKVLKNFLAMYLAKYGNHRNSLMFCLLQSYVAKANGKKNSEYGTKVLTFFLRISNSDKISFGFVS